MIRTHRELVQLPTFEERYRYLRLSGTVGATTFGYDRYLNQLLYRSARWRSTRDKVIIRDEGCDLAMLGYEVQDRIIIHHMNPITIADIENDRDEIYDLRFLITTSHYTHEAIHYGDERLLPQIPIERKPFDTVPWNPISR